MQPLQLCSQLTTHQQVAVNAIVREALRVAACCRVRGWRQRPAHLMAVGGGLPRLRHPFQLRLQLLQDPRCIAGHSLRDSMLLSQQTPPVWLSDVQRGTQRLRRQSAAPVFRSKPQVEQVATGRDLHRANVYATSTMTWTCCRAACLCDADGAVITEHEHRLRRQLY